MKKNNKKEFSQDEIGRIIEMAWEDRTPFEAITSNFEIVEPEVIKIMRRELKKSSFKIWRKRVSGKKTKHLALRDNSVIRFRCPTQNSRY
jgi:uncharacterized protein (TIGR03643 family)|tara:strand:+ start:251 stop:520 length:270 start_codon:yes stop_codon:yes gene_type:complete